MTYDAGGIGGVRSEVHIGEKSDGHVIDLTALDRLRRLGGKELIGRMIVLFLSHAEVTLGRAVASFEQGDLAGVERAAHSLKSSAGNMGVPEVQRLANEIERLVADRKTSTLRSLLTHLEEALVRAKSRLEEEKKGLGL